MAQFESLEGMIRSPVGRLTLLRWGGVGAGLAVLGFVPLARWADLALAGTPIAAAFGFLVGLRVWLAFERLGIGRPWSDAGPAQWEAHGRQLEELKARAATDPDAAVMYVQELQPLVDELRQLRDNPSRAIRKLRLPIDEILAPLERDLADGYALLKKAPSNARLERSGA